MQMLNEGPWSPVTGGCILAAAKAASCPSTAEELTAHSEHSQHHVKSFVVGQKACEIKVVFPVYTAQ